MTAGRPPAVVRPTAGAVSLQSCGHRARAIDKCLRDATRPTGSGLSYMLPSSRVPSGHDVSATKRSRRCLVISAATAGIAKATSPALLVPDAAHTTGSWPFGAPFLTKSLRKQRQLARSTPSPCPTRAGASEGRCQLVDEDVLPG